MLVALLFAHLALADDAPLAPVGYTLVPDAQRLREGQAMAGCDAERLHLQDAVIKQHEGTVAVPLVVALIVVSVLAGGAVGVGVVLAVKK